MKAVGMKTWKGDIEMGIKFCKWKENNYGDWETKCGNCFEFMHDGPSHNKFEFCPYCSFKIIETFFNDEDDK